MDAGSGQSSKHFWAGARDALALPAWIVSLALMGIGPMARDIGFPALAAILSTLLMWAGPAQMIFFGMLSAGASLTAVAIAVTLSAIRLLPMAVSIIPLLRHSKPSHGTLIYVSHLVAVTAWVEGIRRLPSMPPEERLPYFLGFGTACMVLATIFTGLGYFLAGTVPLTVGAALLFMSPAFFIVSLVGGAKFKGDWFAVGAGFCMAPLFQYLFGRGSALFLTGLIGGTLAFLLRRWETARAAQ
ncbi:MAG: AzlC family ABC transporter permease [Beijerinckiaceae bacterium]